MSHVSITSMQGYTRYQLLKRYTAFTADIYEKDTQYIPLSIENLIPDFINWCIMKSMSERHALSKQELHTLYNSFTYSGQPEQDDEWEIEIKNNYDVLF